MKKSCWASKKSETQFFVHVAIESIDLLQHDTVTTTATAAPAPAPATASGFSVHFCTVKLKSRGLQTSFISSYITAILNLKGFGPDPSHLQNMGYEFLPIEGLAINEMKYQVIVAYIIFTAAAAAAAAV
ncbi:hypothetical protein GQX74_008092 [Glossina fuscipes]|nr:hypothetical protein GQX74_008092 [Glossina fuscipes]